MNDFLFPGRFHWAMSTADRAAMLHLLSRLRPDVSIEVGTDQRGSLEPIARASRKVYSIDINPLVAEALRPSFYNVEFLVGDSVMLDEALSRIESTAENLQFVAVDVAHAAAALTRDINRLLRYRPAKPLCIAIHGSFNPELRRGILEADWSGNLHVHRLAVDFSIGIASRDYEGDSKMWGGFSVALLLPEPRAGAVQVSEDAKEQFEAVRQVLGG
jgi:hypothetical protein